MLRQVLGVGRVVHISNTDLYLKFPKLSAKIGARRVKFAKFVLWEPMQGQAQRGRGHLTYVDLLRRDTGFVTAGEISTCMRDREIWRQLNFNIIDLRHQPK